MSKSRLVYGTTVEKEMKQKPKLQFKKEIHFISSIIMILLVVKLSLVTKYFNFSDKMGIGAFNIAVDSD